MQRRVFHLAIGLALTVFLLFSFTLRNGDAVETSDLPIHIHLTWQDSNMSGTITVTWQTLYNDSGSTVFYDDVSRNGNASLYRYVANGATHTYAGASGYIHDVELTDLTSNSTYYFVCGGEKGRYSNERSFRTAPTQPSHLRFVVGGDSRTNLAQRDDVSKAMSQFNPSFVLMSGDLVNDGSNQTEWDNFFDSLDQYWIGSNNFTIPIVPCLGNHENNAINYHEQFALPGNEQWYSLNWGNFVHITVLNSEANPTGEQLTWLENDLASHQNYTWKFAVFHKPPFSSSSDHGSWLEGRANWSPLFDKYRVDIVFSGHVHNYERSKPINYTASQTTPQDSYSNGTMYVVSGGWGAPLHPNGTSWWTADSATLYHFVLVDIFANGTLNLQAKDGLGSTLDEVAQKLPLIPEFPSSFLLLVLIVITLLVAIVRKSSACNRRPQYRNLAAA